MSLDLYLKWRQMRQERHAGHKPCPRCGGRISKNKVGCLRCILEFHQEQEATCNAGAVEAEAA